jgi:hypothetical protein
MDHAADLPLLVLVFGSLEAVTLLDTLFDGNATASLVGCFSIFPLPTVIHCATEGTPSTVMKSTAGAQTWHQLHLNNVGETGRTGRTRRENSSIRWQLRDVKRGRPVIMNVIRKAELNKPLAHVNCMGRESGADDDRLGFLDVRGGVVVEVLFCEVRLPVVATVRQGGREALGLRAALVVVGRVEALDTVLGRVGHAWAWGYEIGVGVGAGDEYGA